MKISEFIDKLEKFKDTYGNLEVGIARINSAYEAYEDKAYYSDIVILRAHCCLFSDYDKETIDFLGNSFCALN